MTVIVYPTDSESWTGEFSKIAKMFNLSEEKLKFAIENGTKIIFDGEEFTFDCQEDFDPKAELVKDFKADFMKLKNFIEWFSPKEEVKIDLMISLRSLYEK